MSCEQEAARLANAEDNFRWQRNECEQIAIQKQNPNDPAVIACRGRLEGARRAANEARAAYNACLAAATEARLLQSSGFVTFLRVNEHRYAHWGGGQTNEIHAEVVFRLHTRPGKAFGFELHDDGDGPARRGMLDLLRDAFLNDREVTVDYDQLVQPPNENSVAYRVWMTKTHAPLDVSDMVGPLDPPADFDFE